MDEIVILGNKLKGLPAVLEALLLWRSVQLFTAGRSFWKMSFGDRCGNPGENEKYGEESCKNLARGRGVVYNRKCRSTPVQRQEE